MQYLLFGVKRVKFTNSEGELIKGHSLFLGSEIPSDQGVGVEVDKVFLSDTRISEIQSSLKVNSRVDVIFNKYGKVQDIVDVPDK